MKKDLLYLCLLLLTPPVFAGQFFQDFSTSSAGASTFNEGSKVFSTALGSVASVVDGTYTELQLTASGSAGTVSAYMLPDLDTNAAIYAFSAKWNSPVYGLF